MRLLEASPAKLIVKEDPAPTNPMLALAVKILILPAEGEMAPPVLPVRVVTPVEDAVMVAVPPRDTGEPVMEMPEPAVRVMELLEREAFGIAAVPMVREPPKEMGELLMVMPGPATYEMELLARAEFGMEANVPVTVDPEPEKARPEAPRKEMAPAEEVAGVEFVLNVNVEEAVLVMVTVLPEAEVVMPTPPRISRVFAVGVAVPTLVTKLVGTAGLIVDEVLVTPAWLMR
jgi:hypothetical protein